MENIVSVYSHPDYPSLARQVDVDKIWFCRDGKAQKVVLEIPVDTLDPDGNAIEEMHKTFFLTADNDTMVNDQGVPDPEGVIGEYDFFQAIIKQPIVIWDLLNAKVQYASLIQRLH